MAILTFYTLCSQDVLIWTHLLYYSLFTYGLQWVHRDSEETFLPEKSIISDTIRHAQRPSAWDKELTNGLDWSQNYWPQTWGSSGLTAWPPQQEVTSENLLCRAGYCTDHRIKPSDLDIVWICFSLSQILIMWILFVHALSQIKCLQHVAKKQITIKKHV